MMSTLNNSLLLAAAEGSMVTAATNVAILLAVFIVPFALGFAIAKAVRMSDYGIKIGLILFTLAVAGAIIGFNWDGEENMPRLNWGVDLRGGVILVYEVSDEQGSAQQPADAAAEGGQVGASAINMPALIVAIRERLNPSGTKEIAIRQFGPRQIEIVVPDADAQEIEFIKRQIVTAGELTFRIVANRRDHAELIELAEVQANTPKRMSDEVRDADGKLVGVWGRVVKSEEPDRKAGIRKFATDVTNDLIRDVKTGQIIRLRRNASGQVVDENDTPIDGQANHLEDYLDRQGLKQVDVLLAVEKNEKDWVTGNDLSSVSGGYDESARPQLNFSMNAEGTKRMRVFTTKNRPDPQTGFHRRMAILFDEKVLSAPQLITTISDRGRITGDFDQDEIDFLVNILDSGKLSATLNKQPISENQIGSLLGVDTIRKGQTAIVVSLLVVLIFILIYYRFAGLIACLALVANLVFILAMMVLLKATVSLPGLAGLVLTVGMSVDANVLIFERIREELARGAALRMAIRNGFQKATTTIVDANLTTLITAFVLYAIGTDQVRGFAVTLILGILMSMYTAIFCSRVFFDIAERNRWMAKLSMMQILSATNINFIGKRYIAGAVSTVLIIIGLVAVFSRGKSILDIDFSEGTSVVMQLTEPMEHGNIKAILDEKLPVNENGGKNTYTLNQYAVEGKPDGTVWKIDTSMPKVESLKDFLKKNFKLDHYELDYDPAQLTVADTSNAEAPVSAESIPISPEAEASSPAEPSDAEAATTTPAEDASAAETPAEGTPAKDASEEAATPDTGDGARIDLPSANVLAVSEALLLAPADDDPPADDAAPAADEAKPADEATPAADDGKSADDAAPAAGDGKSADDAAPAADDAKPVAATTDDAAADTTPTGDSTGSEDAGSGEAAPPVSVNYVLTTGQLKFGNKIPADTLKAEVEAAADRAGTPVADVVVSNAEWDGESNEGFTTWDVTIDADKETTDAIFTNLKEHFDEEPVWQLASEIGSRVAGDTQQKAIGALLVSLLGIVGYIWIRFQRVIFGLAAVVALVHDVLITLGAIAVSAYLADYLGFLKIEEFKISLPIVAAFLTIIGYSLNDTIVVFDRIREVRGKNPNLDEGMINTSINQTLSRTLLTSVTTFIVVGILYWMGGQGIHGFAFALVIGVIVGTYSSIFVASPVLLWMTGKSNKDSGGAKKEAATV